MDRESLIDSITQMLTTASYRHVAIVYHFTRSLLGLNEKK